MEEKTKTHKKQGYERRCSRCGSMALSKNGYTNYKTQIFTCNSCLPYRFFFNLLDFIITQISKR